jgi:predicted HicB family RNase H-like nuclease
MSSDNPMGSAAQGTAPKQPDASKLKREVEKEDTTQLNVDIPESIHRRLRMQSAATKRPMKELAAEALDDFLPEA